MGVHVDEPGNNRSLRAVHGPPGVKLRPVGCDVLNSVTSNNDVDVSAQRIGAAVEEAAGMDDEAIRGKLPAPGKLER